MTAVSVHPLDITAAHARVNGQKPPKPPMSVRGYVEDAAFEGILADALETVSDVAWPTSVTTYHQMRRDAKLAAILAGYAQMLLRATWQIDGTGCRPEVVRLVAHDLDLPVIGEDTPGVGRAHGLSWHDHLRAALSMLVFGHSGFELQAELINGTAHLVGLWDRPQHTISQIHVEPKTGAFNGISQELTGGPFDKPEITADRLAWYCHDREGAAWYGTSLLRPAFAAWLFKKEMMRVLATSSRRFGMGVPAVEWAANATPTPQQFSEAQKAITAARVGDQSGVTMPPGAMLALKGLSGGTPNTMEFVKWLDQQMSTAALMGHLDLGQTQTGSRALGQAFIDAWTLSLESIAEEIADVVTRQVAARIVGWNYGAEEPVPKIWATGIASRREVTADSLQALLSSGALSADPGLEEWVRKEYRLPARSADERPAQVQVPDRPDRTEPEPATEGEPEPPEPAPAEPVAASARRAPSPAGPGPGWVQPELPILAQTGDEPEEPPEPAEDEVEQAQQDANAALLALLAAWPAVAAPLVAALATGATTAAAGGAVVTLDALTVPARVVRDITAAVAQTMLTLASTSAAHARDSLTGQGVDLPDPDVTTGQLRQQAQAATELIVAGYRSAAARAAQTAAGPDQVGDAVRRALDEMTDTASGQQQGQRRGFVAGELDNALHAAVHWGRVAVFRALDALGVPVAWTADESNEDSNRCEPCSEINGERYETLAAALADYPAGKYIRCQGRWRCRGQLRPRIVRRGVPGA